MLSRRAVLLGLGSVVAPAVLRFSYVRAEPLAGDGLVNDLPALRKMMAEAEVNGRGIIELPPGVFRLVPEPQKSALAIPANVQLRGAGRDKTKLVMADGSFGHALSAPYGWVQISDLTVDGNEQNRAGQIGHNIRVHGDNLKIERVNLINAVTYSIAIGQRGFARDVIVRDVEIVNSGADGIDIKNKLGRTAGILIENVTVRGFGRPMPSLPAHLVGTNQDVRRNKAGVDLRGKCEVRNLTIIGLRPDRDGLRFRQGEAGQGKFVGEGAHGSKASNVVVRGTAGQRNSNGIAVYARDVELTGVDISEAWAGIEVTAEHLTVTGGKIASSGGAALIARPFPQGKPDKLTFSDVAFENERKFIFRDAEASFVKCRFASCRDRLGLDKTPGVSLTDCKFDATC